MSCGKCLATLLVLSAVSLGCTRKTPLHGRGRGGRLEQQQQQRFAGTQLDPSLLCLKQSVLSIEHPRNTKGWMNTDDWGAEFRALNQTEYPFIQIGIDGFPCAEKGCCQHSMTIRTNGSDWKVVQWVLNDYADFLIKILPWTPSPFNAILEGGGNIGVATSLFAFMYPNTQVIALEPEPENCMLLRNNTARFPNVHVKCVGLWGKENAAVALMPGEDGEQWGWRLKEVGRKAKGAVPTTTVPALMKEFDVTAFDLAKIDIEGAEYNLFGPESNTSWLSYVQLLALKLHGEEEERSLLVEEMLERGYSGFGHGEFEVFTRHNLHEWIGSN